MQYRIFTLLGVTALVVALGASANAAPANNFWGPGGSGPNGPNTFGVQITASGSVIGTIAPGSKLLGNDITFVPNPATIPISLVGQTATPGSYTFNSAPSPTGEDINGVPTKTRTTIDPGTLDFLGVQNLNMNLINAVTPSPMNIALSPITLPIWITIGGTPVVPFPVTLLGNITITEMEFFQNGPAVIGPGNTYDVPGQIRAKADAIINGGLLGVLLDDTFEFVEDVNLLGTASVTDQGFDNYKIEMDGNLNLALPLAIQESLQFDDSVQNVFLTATVDVDASVLLAVSYHLEDVMTVPEPGTFVLLGMG